MHTANTFTPMLQSSSSPSHSRAEVDTSTWTLDLHEIFECVYFKLMVSDWSKQANKQPNIHTHMQCSHTAVWGLLRLAPKYIVTQVQPYAL